MTPLITVAHGSGPPRSRSIGTGPPWAQQRRGNSPLDPYSGSVTTEKRPTASAASLRGRWSPEDAALLASRFVDQDRFVGRTHEIASPHGTTVEGRVDLRGVKAARGYSLSIKYLALERLDLSHAQGALHMFETEVSDSRFDKISASGSMLDRLFVRCSFRSARLTRARIGRTLIDCDFTNASMRKLALGENTVFERCTFHGTDLADAKLVGGRFVECTFADTTFSALTTFDRCDFRGTLPELGPARRVRCTHDGTPLPDSWPGHADAEEFERDYLDRYVRAVRAGTAETMPLDPESPPR